MPRNREKNAANQRAFKQRQHESKSGLKRFGTWVTPSTADIITRLARHTGMNKQQVIAAATCALLNVEFPTMTPTEKENFSHHNRGECYGNEN